MKRLWLLCFAKWLSIGVFSHYLWMISCPFKGISGFIVKVANFFEGLQLESWHFPRNSDELEQANISPASIGWSVFSMSPCQCLMDYFIKILLVCVLLRQQHCLPNQCSGLCIQVCVYRSLFKGHPQFPKTGTLLHFGGRFEILNVLPKGKRAYI